MEAGKRRLHELRQAVAFLKLNPIPIHDSLSVSRPLIIIRAAPAHWTSFTRTRLEIGYHCICVIGQNLDVMKINGLLMPWWSMTPDGDFETGS